MEFKLSAEQQDLIKRIAREEGIEVPEITTGPGSSKGDNYSGIITRVDVEAPKHKLHLIMKTAASNDNLREKIPLRQGFIREIEIYESILPAFESLLKKQGCPDAFSAYPKEYGSCIDDYKECIVLENLKEAGYDLWDRQLPMDWNHISLVLKEYGRLHAVSLAAKEKDPELYERLKKDFRSVWLKNFNDVDEVVRRSRIEDEKINTTRCIRNAIDAIKDNQDAVDALERFYLVAYKYMNENIRLLEDELVLSHGDSWCNNLLFKYEDPPTKKPSGVCLIDWQYSCMSSPALDLSYFLCTSAPKEIFADYEKFLRIYHDAASETLRSVGCDPEIVYPFDLLERHWSRFVKFGVYMATLLLKVMLSEIDEIPDISAVADSESSIGEGYSFSSRNDYNYGRRIADIVSVCVENNWM